MANSKTPSFLGFGLRFLANLEAVGEIVEVTWTHPQGICARIALPNKEGRSFPVILQRMPSNGAAPLVELRVGSNSIPIQTPEELDAVPILANSSKFWSAAESVKAA